MNITAKEQPNICPYSCREINGFDLCSVGVFWPESCGHKFVFDNEFYKKEGAALQYQQHCPICHAKITNISDGSAVSALRKEGGSYEYPLEGLIAKELDKNDGVNNRVKVISFRQQKINYRIGVQCEKETAQERIAEVLGTHVSLIKILHKGKILYPARSTTGETEISEKILSISSKHKLSGKPNLMVMSTRVSEIRGRSDLKITGAQSWFGVFYQGISRSLWRVREISMNICMGAILFVKTLFTVKPIDYPSRD